MTSIRKEVAEFLALGPFPSEDATVEALALHEDGLLRIKRPVSDDEARALLSSFGPDDCFGMAWTLLHLIESAPHSALDHEPEPGANLWLRELWERKQRSL